MTNRPQYVISMFRILCSMYLSFEIEVKGKLSSLLAPLIKHWTKWAYIQDSMLIKNIKCVK